MKVYGVSKLLPGMQTAAPVYGRDRLLLNSDVILTPQTIAQLPIWGVFYVYVREGEAERVLESRAA